MVYLNSIYIGGFIVPEERYGLPIFNEMTLVERLCSLGLAVPLNLGFIIAASGLRLREWLRYVAACSIFLSIIFNIYYSIRVIHPFGIPHTCIWMYSKIGTIDLCLSEIAFASIYIVHCQVRISAD